MERDMEKENKLESVTLRDMKGTGRMINTMGRGNFSLGTHWSMMATSKTGSFIIMVYTSIMMIKVVMWETSSMESRMDRAS